MGASYLFPSVYDISATPSTITQAWSIDENAPPYISFLTALCLHYNCYWSHEGKVQDNAASMLRSLVKMGSKMRLAIIASPSFRQIVMYYCLTCGIRHSASQEEFESTVQTKIGNTDNSIVDTNMLRGFHRLPYKFKGKLLTGILIACSEREDETSNAFLNDCLSATQDAFSSLVNALRTKQIKPDSVDAVEMACLCISLYDSSNRVIGNSSSEQEEQKYLDVLCAIEFVDTAGK